jgi:hypothetical protein
MDATADSATVLLASVWDKQSVRSQAANNLKQSLFRARTTCLLLTILAAVLATVAVQIASISDLTALTARILAAGAALSMGLVALMQRRPTVNAYTTGLARDPPPRH